MNATRCRFFSGAGLARAETTSFRVLGLDTRSCRHRDPRARLARRRQSLSVAMGKKDETPEERAARKEKEKKGKRPPCGSRAPRRRPQSATPSNAIAASRPRPSARSSDASAHLLPPLTASITRHPQRKRETRRRRTRRRTSPRRPPRSARRGRPRRRRRRRRRMRRALDPRLAAPPRAALLPC